MNKLLFTFLLAFSSFSAFSAGDCAKGKVTQIMNASRVETSFCWNELGSLKCQPLTDGQEVKILATCNDFTTDLLLCTEWHGGTTKVQLPGGIFPKEFRDYSGTLVGCGIEKVPTRNGYLKFDRSKPYPASDVRDRVLRCEGPKGGF